MHDIGNLSEIVRISKCLLFSFQSPSTPPMELLNTCLVTTPKNRGDKKSDFLKALKMENDLNMLENGCPSDDVSGQVCKMCLLFFFFLENVCIVCQNFNQRLF